MRRLIRTEKPSRLRASKPRGSGKTSGIRTVLASDRGISLVEVLIAAIIVGIAVISVSYMFGAAGADVVKLGSQRVCLQVAQEEMEYLLSQPYDAVELAEGQGTRRFRRPPNTDVTAPDGTLFVVWQIDDIDEPANGVGIDYKRIILTLYDDHLDNEVWPPGNVPPFGEVERVVTLVTLFSP